MLIPAIIINGREWHAVQHLPHTLTLVHKRFLQEDGIQNDPPLTRLDYAHHARMDSTPIPGWYFLRESEPISRLGGPKVQKLMLDDTCHFDRDEVGKTKTSGFNQKGRNGEEKRVCMY